MVFGVFLPICGATAQSVLKKYKKFEQFLKIENLQLGTSFLNFDKIRNFGGSGAQNFWASNLNPHISVKMKKNEN